MKQFVFIILALISLDSLYATNDQGPWPLTSSIWSFKGNSNPESSAISPFHPSQTQEEQARQESYQRRLKLHEQYMQQHEQYMRQHVQYMQQQNQKSNRQAGSQNFCTSSSSQNWRIRDKSVYQPLRLRMDTNEPLRLRMDTKAEQDSNDTSKKALSQMGETIVPVDPDRFPLFSKFIESVDEKAAHYFYTCSSAIRAEIEEYIEDCLKHGERIKNSSRFLTATVTRITQEIPKQSIATDTTDKTHSNESSSASQSTNQDSDETDEFPRFHSYDIDPTAKRRLRSLHARKRRAIKRRIECSNILRNPSAMVMYLAGLTETEILDNIIE